MGSAALRAQTPTIDLEVATATSAPIDAQQKWYDVLKPLELNSLRLRAARPRESPRIDAGGTPRRPSLRVVAVLDAKNQLQLPGGTFARGDTARLRQYLRTLREEGVDGVTADRGRFGLTAQQFKIALDELSEVVGFSTQGKPLREVVDALADGLAHRLVVEPELLDRLEAAGPVSIELEKLSRGASLAMLLRAAGMAFRPQMDAGELRYRIELDPGNSNDQTPGLRDEDSELVHWPIGWRLEASPVRAAPGLFEKIRAEIGGYSLAEAIDAISPRLAIPLMMDHVALADRKIDPEARQVELPAGEYTYHRILERILRQAELKGTIRVDERGTPFFWISPLVTGH